VRIQNVAKRKINIKVKKFERREEGKKCYPIHQKKRQKFHSILIFFSKPSLEIQSGENKRRGKEYTPDVLP